MTQRNGKLIVIEGTDGSGKRTQSELLQNVLQQKGYTVASASFPQYGKKSAGLVEEYLNKKYGEPDEVDPYAASLFYALDRFDFSAALKELLARGHIVVLDRYVDSNAGHQGGKIHDELKRARFLSWLYKLEYKILKVPKPDLVIILHVPAHIGQELVSRKQDPRTYIEKGTRDSHEENLLHLQNAEASYLWLARQHPHDHIVVECTENGQILDRAIIAEKVLHVIQEKLGL